MKTVGKRLVLVVSIAFAALFSVGLLSFRENERHTDSERWVSHTYVVLATLADFRIGLSRAKADQRAFLLSGDQSYSASCETDLSQASRAVEDLRELTSDNPRQQEFLRQLGAPVENVRTEFRKQIEEQKHRVIAPDVSFASDSDASLSAVLHVIGEMEQGEKDLLAQRSARENLSAARTGAAIVAGNVLSSLLILAAILMLYREMNKSQRAESALGQLNAELETRNAELGAMNKELESFSYSVSHDLRAPLRAIDGFSLALLEEHRDKLSPEGQSHLERVRAATIRMANLIDDMLKLARIVRSDVAEDDVNLSALAEEVAEQLRTAEPERKATIEITPGLKTLGDRLLLRAMLENLLGNAWKFTSKCPVSRIELGVTNGNAEPVFFVRDNGAGFDMRYADKLFGVFQRLHGDRDYPGTGVGLATVQRIVRKHGGKIWAESSVGHGATFFFVLRNKASTQPIAP
jgi:signal transduction histidine kinase